MRTFFCFELPGKVKDEIKSMAESITGPAYVKWVSRENLHITLKFLGDVGRDQVQRIENSASSTAARFEPFEITIDKLSGFPNPGFPKVIWLGSSSPPPDIDRLHDDLESELEELGFERENRDYVPHVTLGRTKDDDERKIERLGDNLTALDHDFSEKVSIDKLTLMKSELKPQGPEYTPLFRLKLGEAK